MRVNICYICACTVHVRVYIIIIHVCVLTYMYIYTYTHTCMYEWAMASMVSELGRKSTSRSHCRPPRLLRHGALVVVLVILVDVDGRRFQLATGEYVIDHSPSQIPRGYGVLAGDERVQVVGTHQLIVLQHVAQAPRTFENENNTWRVNVSVKLKICLFLMNILCARCNNLICVQITNSIYY